MLPAGSCRGRAPGQKVRGESPPPRSWSTFWFLDVQWKLQICPFFYNMETQRNQTFVLFQKNSWVATKLGGWSKTGGVRPTPGPGLKPPLDIQTDGRQPCPIRLHHWLTVSFAVLTLIKVIQGQWFLCHLKANLSPFPRYGQFSVDNAHFFYSFHSIPNLKMFPLHLVIAIPLRAVCAEAPSCWKMNPVGSRRLLWRNDNLVIIYKQYKLLFINTSLWRHRQ